MILLNCKRIKKQDTAIDDAVDGEVFVKGESDSSDDEKELRTEKVMISKTMIGL